MYLRCRYTNFKLLYHFKYVFIPQVDIRLTRSHIAYLHDIHMDIRYSSPFLYGKYLICFFEKGTGIMLVFITVLFSKENNLTTYS